MKKKILFICKHNKFRSKVGEAIFNKLNKNKNIIAESAGTIGSDNPTPYNVVKILREKGYRVARMKARKINLKKINDYDILIVVADNVDPQLFKDSGYRWKIIWWKVSDCMSIYVPGIRKRVDDIEKRVKKLIKRLGD